MGVLDECLRSRLLAAVICRLCIEGDVEIELVCEPAFDYGREEAEWSVSDNRHSAQASGSKASIC